ncbi:MAG: bifunctional phosphopantothenoylcysteine decarboxylase/phosphopantothenate--cysteine ligase CoaBC [Firmicutes bacterium]|nr:bifunctional phosphopantothenoylcysteine decarboxylase/phosphopantothenate--cysteine ligase CoaBC [Alicyclobacillaceae bacterium]MCL6496439.1 bifunctional phosphopantothenoylcysteine decarboxylase/phosphopantothenate--cysteine ligase CoaBC [Bacillota bacterium]
MRVVVGVGGGIAAYKVCAVVSALVQRGHEVQVVMTEAATHFVAPLTFAALSGRPVAVEAEAPVEAGPIGHVALAHWADALVVAPAPGELLARLAHGLAHDMLGLVYLGLTGPRLVAPAMEPEMWAHPAIQRAVATLTADGVTWVGPEFGRMASGYQGVGRMAEPEAIVEAFEAVTAPKDLRGLHCLITAGPTWEFFDPVRLLTNPSTGTMGVELAREAVRRGATVDLVHGPRVAVPRLPGLSAWPVVSARDMLARCLERLAAGPAVDVVIAAAAVSDFRPAEPLPHKAHKADVASVWPVEPNPDVVAEVSRRLGPAAVRVGFAAETDGLETSARKKLASKGLDFVVANPVGPDRGFGDAPYQAWWIGPEGPAEALAGDKRSVARAIWDRVRRRWEEKAGTKLPRQ